MDRLSKVSYKRILIEAVVLCTALTPLCIAQASSWDNLARFRRGEKIEVMDSHMRVLTGGFVSYSPDALTIRTDAAEREMPRAEVARVTAFSRTRRGRNALIGLAVGAGAGAGLGAAIPPTELSRGAMAGGLSMLGGGIGAVAGALVSLKERRVVYYRANN
jgi:hypothetical protein